MHTKSYDMTSYPSTDIIGDIGKNKEWLPKYLRIFMEALIKLPVLQASIVQAIVHAVKPRSSLPPILFGTSVEMDHLFGSKWLLNEATCLGWCVCPDEVTHYKQSIVLNEKIEDYVNKLSDGCFGQW